MNRMSCYSYSYYPDASLFIASAAYEDPFHPIAYSETALSLTDVISLEPDEMHCLAEGSILVAS